MDKLEKLRKEVERLQNELIQEKEKGFGSDTDNACILELQNILTYIDSLQKEPVSDDLEKTSKEYADKNYAEWLDFVYGDERDDHYSISNAFKAGANWQKQQIINKACEYLKDNIWRNLYFVNGEAGFPTAEFIKGFRKAIEE